MILLKQTSAYLLAHGVAAIFGFLSVILFTRLLTPTEYGVYVIATSLVTILITALYNWVKLSTLRMQAEGEAVDVRMTTLVAFALASAFMPIGGIAVVWFGGVSWERVAAAMALALALGFFDLGLEIMKARQETLAYMRAAILRAAASIVIALTLVLTGFGGIGLIFGIAAGYMLASLVGAPLLWRGPRRPFDRQAFKAMLWLGLPMAASGALYALHAALDRLVVATLLGDHDAGVYGASADLVRQMIVFPALSVAAAIIPVAIRTFAEEGHAQTDGHLLHSGELLMAIVFPAAVGLAIIAPHIAALILGSDFREAAITLIPILCLAWAIQSISQQYIQVSFYIAKTPGLLALQCLSVLLTNLALIGPMVTTYGLKGAAFSFLIAEVVGLVTGYFLGRRAYSLPFAWKPALRVGVAVAIMALPTWVVENAAWSTGYWGLAATIATGVVVYAAAGYALDLAGVRAAVKNVLDGRRGEAQISSQAKALSTGQ